jgi:antimicrobial peptide system SdpA family protein
MHRLSASAAFFLLIIGGILCFIFLVLASSLRTNALSPGSSIRSADAYLFPQGWAFFTKDPRDQMVDVYRFGQDERLECVLQKNSASAYFFGISRKGRRVVLEISLILSTLPDSIWRTSRGEPDIHFLPQAITVHREPFMYVLTKGKYLIIEQRPIPWAWAKMNQKKYNPTKFLTLNII